MRAQQPIKSKVTTTEFSTKFRSKNEVYSFMVNDVAAYLPPKECVTIYYLKDLVSGNKKCKCSQQLTKSI
jgi:hypothetical protein